MNLNFQERERLARAAYNGYTKELWHRYGRKSELPLFDDLPEDEKEAWRRAADRGAETLLEIQEGYF